MERQRTALIAGREMGPQEVHDFKFSKQRLGGYDTDQVDRFKSRVARQFDALYQRLTEADQRAVLAQQATVQMPAQQPGSEPTALRLLQLAQQNADQVEEQARAEAGQMIENARQQAERIIAEARRHAQGERAQIIEAGTAEARRLNAAYMDLAVRIHDGIRKGSQTLSRMLGEWADEAGPEVAALAGKVTLPGAQAGGDSEPEDEQPAQQEATEAPAAAPRRSRGRTGPQPAASS